MTTSPEAVVASGHEPRACDAALSRATHQPDYCVILQRERVTAALDEPRALDLALLLRPGLFAPAGLSGKNFPRRWMLCLPSNSDKWLTNSMKYRP